MGGMSRNVSNNTLNLVTWLLTNVVSHGKQMVIGYLSVKTESYAGGPGMLCLISCSLSLSIDKGLSVPVVQLCGP